MAQKEDLKVGSIWMHYSLPAPVQITEINEEKQTLSYTFCNSRRTESVEKFLEIFNYVAPERVCEVVDDSGSVFQPELRVVVEGMGGTVYIVTHQHDSKDKGKRGYIAEIGVGEDCWAKNQKEALKIAYDLVTMYNDRRRT